MIIFSNFIPNKYVTFNDKDPPWMTNYLKYNIHCKKSLYLKYLKHGKRNCDYIQFSPFDACDRTCTRQHTRH